MPDRESSSADLDVRLAHGRTALLDAIEQPPLDRIRSRAAARRRRRSAGVAGGAALLGVAIGVPLAVQPWTDDGTTSVPPPVAEAPPGGPVYTAAGITINGLTEASVTSAPGTIADVEFVDPDHGYLVTRCPSGDSCPASLARTTDGGLTWQVTALPPAGARFADVDLVAFAGGRLIVTHEAGQYASADAGRSWQRVGNGAAAGPVRPGPDDMLRAGPDDGRNRGGVEVWRPALPRAGTTPTSPGLEVSWVAAAATADGAWWVGGTRDGAAAVAMTRDGGAHWRTVPLPGAGPPTGPVEVTSLGRQAYAAVLDGNRTLRALFHSADGGQTFTRIRSAGSAPPKGLSGTMVPLLDGRLLVAGTDRRWYVSTDDGATFTRAEGNLPTVGRIDQTVAGYVAYDLFGAGWAAYSADGATWRKLQVN